MPEGVFSGAAKAFTALPPPDDAEVGALLRKVARKVLKLARARHPDGLPPKPLALERLSRREYGKLEYRLKKSSRDGATTLVLTAEGAVPQAALRAGGQAESPPHEVLRRLRPCRRQSAGVLDHRQRRGPR